MMKGQGLGCIHCFKPIFEGRNIDDPFYQEPKIYCEELKRNRFYVHIYGGFSNCPDYKVGEKHIVDFENYPLEDNQQGVFLKTKPMEAYDKNKDYNLREYHD